jgi:hypothetical protein
MRLTCIVAINLLFAALLMVGTSTQQKIDIRLALFSRPLALDDFSLPPAQLSRLGFHSFVPRFRDQFLVQNSAKIPLPLQPKVVLPPGSRIEEVKKLVLSFSRNGIQGGCGDFSSDLASNIGWVIAGHGCCSDHAQVFNAVAMLNGIIAREVGHRTHTFNEYWDESLNKWVWLDPQFALMARDDSDTYLSLAQIHERLRDGGQIQWDFFGSPEHFFATESISESEYFRAQPFGSLTMTLGNNVFEQDYWNRALSFMPKSFRQLLMLVTGIQPKYGYFTGPIGEGPTLASTSKPYEIGIFLYLLSNVGLLIWWARASVRSR